ncbi:sarcosine/dimethylglycine N-methyltransferase [Marmoricola sp. URHA0025 HA25]
MTYAETGLVDSIEALHGGDLGALTQAQRDGIDQFHSGGAEAVERLLPSLRLEPGMTVLDVGSGLGGPARQVALATGCTVLGVDVTPAYVEAATALTGTLGLGGRVAFVLAELGSLERHDFDAAYTMHVQMNVADKGAFFAGIAKRLRPGAPFAVFEVCRRAPGNVALPLPWSIDGSDSFLATPDDLHASIVGAGFEAVEWVDETEWILQWFHELGPRLAAADTAATLPALLADGPTRMLNYAAALADGVLGVHRGAFRRRP